MTDKDKIKFIQRRNSDVAKRLILLAKEITSDAIMTDDYAQQLPSKQRIIEILEKYFGYLKPPMNENSIRILEERFNTVASELALQSEEQPKEKVKAQCPECGNVDYLKFNYVTKTYTCECGKRWMIKDDQPKAEAKGAEDVDLMQYITNLLYSAYDQGNEPLNNSLEFDKWVEEQTGNLKEYAQCQPKGVSDDEILQECKQCGNKWWKELHCRECGYVMVVKKQQPTA